MRVDSPDAPVDPLTRSLHHDVRRHHRYPLAHRRSPHGNATVKFTSYDPLVQVAPFERVLTFDGSFNIRDLGGYATDDGRWTRPQRLYRGDGPHALTPNDAERLASLGLVTIIDLRTPEEVTRGCYSAVLPDVVEYHLPMVDMLPDVTELERWLSPAVVALRYREMLDDAEPTIAEILAILSDPSAYPAMFHCSAGKDRTGIIAAVLLGILNVPADTIIADYALSANSMQRLVDHYQRTYPDAIDQLSRLAPAIVAAHPRAIGGFVDSLQCDYGTFDGYAEAIGVGSAARYVRDAMLT
jgi:protein-tyrosine phosphatase